MSVLTLIPRKEIYPVLFGVVIFILISSVSREEAIFIDEEYTGKENVIRETLQKLYAQRYPKRKILVRFGQIGKHSPAHKLAWTVYRNKRRPGVRKLLEGEIRKFLK